MPTKPIIINLPPYLAFILTALPSLPRVASSKLYALPTFSTFNSLPANKANLEFTPYITLNHDPSWNISFLSSPPFWTVSHDHPNNFSIPIYLTISSATPPVTIDVINDIRHARDFGDFPGYVFNGWRRKKVKRTLAENSNLFTNVRRYQPETSRRVSLMLFKKSLSSESNESEVSSSSFASTSSFSSSSSTSTRSAKYVYKFVGRPIDNIHLTAHNSYKMTIQLPYWITEGPHRVVLMDIWWPLNASNVVAAWDVNITHEDKALRNLHKLSIKSSDPETPNSPRSDLLCDLPPFAVPKIVLPLVTSMRDLCELCTSSKTTAYAVCDYALFNLPFVFGSNTTFGQQFPSPTSQFCYWSGLETFLQKLIFKTRSLYDSMFFYGVRLDNPVAHLRNSLCRNTHHLHALEEPSTCYWLHPDFKLVYTKWMQTVLTQVYGLRRIFPTAQFSSLAQEFASDFTENNTNNRTISDIVADKHEAFLSHITQLKDFFTSPSSEFKTLVKERTNIVECVEKQIDGHSDDENMESSDGKCLVSQLSSDSKLRFVIPLASDVYGWEW